MFGQRCFFGKQSANARGQHTREVIDFLTNVFATLSLILGMAILFS